MKGFLHCVRKALGLLDRTLETLRQKRRAGWTLGTDLDTPPLLLEPEKTLVFFSLMLSLALAVGP